MGKRHVQGECACSELDDDLLGWNTKMVCWGGFQMMLKAAHVP